MVAQPKYWQSYYHGDDATLRLLRSYSFSDRCRYYWGEPALVQAVQTLFANLEQHAPPLVLLSQYLPEQYRAVREARWPTPHRTGPAPHWPVPGRICPRLQRQPRRYPQARRSFGCRRSCERLISTFPAKPRMAMRNTRSRRQQILQLLIEHGSVQVADLVERFGVSAVTIRADLTHFESQGLANRTHGGATLVRTRRRSRTSTRRMR